MSELHDDISTTRMIFMGDATLTDGFKLIGFETIADPSQETMDRVLGSLVDEKQNALVILDNRLASSGSEQLKRVRAEGGRIIVTKVPSLNDTENFHFDVDDKVHSLLGGTEPKGHV